MGANAILAASIAFAKANAINSKMPLYQSLTDDSSYMLPIPMMNIINGGCHANNKLDFQEFMILPTGFDLISTVYKGRRRDFSYIKEVS